MAMVKNSSARLGSDDLGKPLGGPGGGHADQGSGLEEAGETEVLLEQLRELAGQSKAYSAQGRSLTGARPTMRGPRPGAKFGQKSNEIVTIFRQILRSMLPLLLKHSDR
ncbi:MAG: hypothetical protein WDO24_02065 [Pseudomonadota bacterium]